MIRIVSVLLLSFLLNLDAVGQCQDYKDPVTGQLTRTAFIQPNRTEKLIFVYAGDSLTLTYTHSGSSAQLRLGDRASLKTASTTETLYVTSESLHTGYTALAGNFRIAPQRLALLRNPETIRFYLMGTTYDVDFSKKEQREWNQILNCILPPRPK